MFGTTMAFGVVATPLVPVGVGVDDPLELAFGLPVLPDGIAVGGLVPLFVEITVCLEAEAGCQ